MKRYNPCHTPQGPASIQESERGSVVLYAEALQIERTMQFWRTRCRELKNGLRKIEGMAIASGDKNIEHVAHDALNGGQS